MKNNINILIVDDDPNMHMIYEDMFRSNSRFGLSFADNVEDAAVLLNEKNFHLVFLDILMEPLSGDYLFLKIRDDDKIENNDIPIFIISVLDNEKIEALKNIPNTYFFQKPLNGPELLNAVNSLFPD